MHPIDITAGRQCQTTPTALTVHVRSDGSTKVGLNAEPTWPYLTRRLIRMEGELLVSGDLFVHECPDLQALPQAVRVHWYASIRECPVLASLPEALVVTKNLLISRCPSLRAIPPGVSVDVLTIEDCPALTWISPAVHVGYSIEIESDRFCGVDSVRQFIEDFNSTAAAFRTNPEAATEAILMHGASKRSHWRYLLARAVLEET